MLNIILFIYLILGIICMIKYLAKKGGDERKEENEDKQNIYRNKNKTNDENKT